MLKITLEGTLDELIEFGAKLAKLKELGGEPQVDPAKELEERIWKIACHPGGLIAAIKAYRAATDATLKDAKDYVEALRERRGHTP